MRDSAAFGVRLPLACAYDNRETRQPAPTTGYCPSGKKRRIESDLVADYQDADQRGIEFIGLLAREERRLTAYVAALVPNWADVDDLLQATKLKLWEQFGSYDPAGDFVHGLGRSPSIRS